VSALDEFLDPLHRGIREVVVPKEAVTEPLGTAWKVSPLNLPTPGVIASYRKGRYHAHETGTEWHVHLDRYDPERHPILHLIDDAPLVFLIGGTLHTLLIDARTALRRTTEEVLDERGTGWNMMVVIGAVLMLAGVIILLDPVTILFQLVALGLRLVIMGLGLYIIGEAVQIRPFRITGYGRMVLGLAVLILGLESFFLPFEWLPAAVVVVLGGWAFASAFVSLVRSFLRRRAVPEGLFKRVAIGGISLLFAVLIFAAPDVILTLLSCVLAVIAFLSGLSLLVNGLWLRKRTKDLTANPL